MKEYNKTEIVVLSPGRINLIGEHIDYHGGCVLPASIDLCIEIRLRKKEGKYWEIKSTQSADSFCQKVGDFSSGNILWHLYVLGVLKCINDLFPDKVLAFEASISSDLPNGAGLSSSAALTCGLAKGLDQLFALGMSDFQIRSVAQKTENEYVGTQCGGMDQYAVVKGKKDHFLELNCNTFEHRYVQANLGDYQLLLINSNVSHALADSAYNDRVKQTQQALEIIQSHQPVYQLLTEVPLAVLISLKEELSAIQYKRAHHVITEQKRVKDAVSALESADYMNLGTLMYSSHDSLAGRYEVSCDELDFLVDLTRSNDAVLGARMMGGGFGGCTINLVQKDKVETIIEFIESSYLLKFQKKCTPIRIKIHTGLSCELK